MVNISTTPSSSPRSSGLDTQTARSTSSKVGRVEKKRNISFTLWEYISKGSDEYNVVNKCNKGSIKFSINSFTSTLRSPLRTHGYLLYHDCQQRFDPSGMLVTHAPILTTILQNKLEAMLTTFIGMPSQPFSVIEEDDFLRKRKSINRQFTAPNRFTLRCRILILKVDYEAKMFPILHMKGGQISLTANTWSLRSYKGHFVVTGHWIDNN